MIPLWAQIAGGAAAVASITSSSTQTAHLFKRRTAEGISPTTWVLLTISSLSWFAYGISVRSPQQIVANSTWAFLALPMTWFILNGRPLATRITAEIIVILSLFVLIAIGTIDSSIPGWIGLPASLTLGIPQIRFTLRHGRGPGISLPAWTFLAASSYMWFTYGVGSGEVPVMVNSGIAAVLGTIVVIALIARPNPSGTAPALTVDSLPVTESGLDGVEIPLG